MRRLWSVLSWLLRGPGSTGELTGGFTGTTGKGVQSVSELLIGLSEFADLMSGSTVTRPAAPQQRPERPEGSEEQGNPLPRPQDTPASKVVSCQSSTEPLPPLPPQNAFHIRECERHGLGAGPPVWAELSREEGLQLYCSMKRIRQLEEQVQHLDRGRSFRGRSYHGQEACAAGIEAAILPSDYLITGSPAPCSRFPRGVPARRILAELTGGRGGVAKGMGGSTHFYGGNGSVAAQVSLGAGLALTCRYQGTNQVCITLYGDEAANQGQVFEVFNMASLWKLPCVFVCENNGFGTEKSSFRSSATQHHYCRGGPVPGIRVDGRDVLCVREATRFAVEHCRTGQGPIIMELLTYGDQHTVNPGVSCVPRSEEEVQEEVKSSDPISLLKERLVRSKMAAEEEFMELDAGIKEEVEEASVSVTSDPAPPLEELCHHVYCNSPKMDIRGATAWSSTSSCS